MISDDPPFLNEGDEVSAKYKGAFCEAVITNVQRRVECRVTLKNDQKTSIFYDSDIRGNLKVGSVVEVKREQNRYAEGTIVKIADQSMYTVVFDDGDRNTLKRSKLCPKGDRHFTKSNSLDGLPLTHPEHFWSPVKKESRNRSSATNTGSESDSADDDEEEEEEDEGIDRHSKADDESADPAGRADDESKSQQKPEDRETEAVDREGSTASSECDEKKSSSRSIDCYQDMIGRLAMVEAEDRTKKQVQMVPVLVCLPGADDNRGCIPGGHLLVRSFKDGKFTAVQTSMVKDFNASLVVRTCKWARTGLERALVYQEKMELPADWDKKELLGWSEDDEDATSGDEQNEKKDRFVAELYRFMEERGTPINKVPSIAPGVDLNLCTLYRAVQSLGGYNKVTNLMKWNAVTIKLNIKSGAVIPSKVKDTYKKFLRAFEERDKRLGCTMITPIKGRSTPGRNLLSFREREVDGKNLKSKKAASAPLASSKLSAAAADDVDAKNPSTPPGCGQNPPADPKGAPTLIRTGKKVKDVHKGFLSTPDVANRSVKSTKADPDALRSSESSGSSAARVGKPLMRDGHPKNVRKISKDEAEKKGKDEVKPALLQSQSNPNLLGSLSGRKAADAKPPKAASDDMNREARSRPSQKNFAPSKQSKGTSSVHDGDMNKADRMRSASKVDWSEEAKKSEKMEKLLPGRRTLRRLASSNGNDDLKSEETGGSDLGVFVGHSSRRKPDDILGAGTRVSIRYGKGKVTKIYEAKILEADVNQGVLKYLVHYNGWNSRYDEWLERDEIVSILEFVPPQSSDLDKVKNPSSQSKITASRKKSSVKSMEEGVSTLKQKKSVVDDNHHRCSDEPAKASGRKRGSRVTRSIASNESNEPNVSEGESNDKDLSDEDDVEGDKESIKDEISPLEEAEGMSCAEVKMEEMEAVERNVECEVVVEPKEEEPANETEEAELLLEDALVERSPDDASADEVDRSSDGAENDVDATGDCRLGPPTLVCSREMDDDPATSEHSRGKRLSSSTECLPCLVNEKDFHDFPEQTDPLECVVQSSEEVCLEVQSEKSEPADKRSARPYRKRKFSEDEDDPEPLERKRQARDEGLDPETADVTYVVDETFSVAVTGAAETVEEMESTCDGPIVEVDDGKMVMTGIDLMEKIVEATSEMLPPGQSEWMGSIDSDMVDCTLLSQFANECTKESDNLMSARLTSCPNDSPPETSSDDCCLEPAEVTVGDEDEEEEDEEEEEKEEDDDRGVATRGDDEEGSTRSEREANREVASYMNNSGTPLQPMMDSLSANEFSTASNDSCLGLVGRRVEGNCPARTKRKKSQDSLLQRKKSRKDENAVPIRRRRSTNRSSTLGNLSESDGESSPRRSSHRRQSLSSIVTTPVKSNNASKCQQTPNKNSAPKSVQHRIVNMKDKNLNFLDLEEGKYLMGEERIEFIMRKISQLKVAYMELKSELACLDRRRRRHRMKEAAPANSLQSNLSNTSV